VAGDGKSGVTQWDQVQAAGVSLITNSSTFRKTQDGSISVASLYFLATRTTFTRSFDCVRRVFARLIYRRLQTHWNKKKAVLCVSECGCCLI
jgi:hypothetical protein